MFNISTFGKNLIIKDKNNNINIKMKSKKEDDKINFINLINNFYLLSRRTFDSESEHGDIIKKYDEPFYILIENLIFLYYGDWQSELIFWYIYDRVDENGDLYPMIMYNELTQEEEEININNAEELYQLIQKIDKQIKNKNKNKK